MDEAEESTQSFLDPQMNSVVEWARIRELAETADKSGDLALSSEHWLEALRRAREFGELDERTVVALRNLAQLSERQEKNFDSEIYWLHALNIETKRLGATHPTIAEHWQKLGNIFHKTCKYNKAVQSYQKALAIYETVFEHSHVVNGIVCGSLARSYYDLDNSVESEHYFKRSIKILTEKLGADHATVTTLVEDYGCLLEFCGRADEAIQLRS